MAQAELFDIESPCISVCEMDDKGYCKGCLRNRTERQLWHVMTDEQKRQVLRLLFVRKQKQKLALAKLAKQALVSEAHGVFSQLTLLEKFGAMAGASETKQDVLVPQALDATVPLQAIPNQSLPVPNSLPMQEALSKNENLSSSQLASHETLKTKNAIQEQNWDFFAVLDASLLPE